MENGARWLPRHLRQYIDSGPGGTRLGPLVVPQVLQDGQVGQVGQEGQKGMDGKLKF
uniref:HDC05908 n=1 Tax=Drosophila melanogaster TaxID=7227 RepID=Q6IGM2_DROME|nr:TPA_inf: HDC05908 [Drosophila melanogaster]